MLGFGILGAERVVNGVFLQALVACGRLLWDATEQRTGRLTGGAG